MNRRVSLTTYTPDSPPKKKQHNKNSIRAQFEKSNMTTALRK